MNVDMVWYLFYLSRVETLIQIIKDCRNRENREIAYEKERFRKVNINIFQT